MLTISWFEKPENIKYFLKVLKQKNTVVMQ